MSFSINRLLNPEIELPPPIEQDRIDDALKDYKCPCRQEGFSRKKHLVAHILHYHPQEDMIAYLYYCTQNGCDQFFYNNSNYIHHLKTLKHKSDNPIPIDQVSKKIYKFSSRKWLLDPESTPTPFDELIIRNLLLEHKTLQRTTTKPENLKWNPMRHSKSHKVRPEPYDLKNSSKSTFRQTEE